MPNKKSTGMSRQEAGRKGAEARWHKNSSQGTAGKISEGERSQDKRMPASKKAAAPSLKKQNPKGRAQKSKPSKLSLQQDRVYVEYMPDYQFRNRYPRRGGEEGPSQAYSPELFQETSNYPASNRFSHHDVFPWEDSRREWEKGNHAKGKQRSNQENTPARKSHRRADYNPKMAERVNEMREVATYTRRPEYFNNYSEDDSWYKSRDEDRPLRRSSRAPHQNFERAEMQMRPTYWFQDDQDVESIWYYYPYTGHERSRREVNPRYSERYFRPDYDMDIDADFYQRSKQVKGYQRAQPSRYSQAKSRGQVAQEYANESQRNIVNNASRGQPSKSHQTPHQRDEYTRTNKSRERFTGNQTIYDFDNSLHPFENDHLSNTYRRRGSMQRAHKPLEAKRANIFYEYDQDLDNTANSKPISRQTPPKRKMAQKR